MGETSSKEELIKVPQFDFKGIKQITIPKRDSDFSTGDYGWSIIKKYMPSIMATHLKNAEKIEYLYNYFLGIQDILSKERLHEVNQSNNNREVENHANRQVEFKVGFLCGENRDYTHKADSNSDDLIFFNRYLTDCDFYAKDIDIKQYIYATGIGVSRTVPRTDIIVSDGIDPLTKAPITRYATEKDGYNVDFEAPFEFDCVDPMENFNVYSSSSNRQKLFSVSYVDVDVSGENDSQPIILKEILVETRYAIFRFKSDTKFYSFYWTNDEVEITIKPSYLRYLPLIEFSVNRDRIGIIEKNRSSFNTINIFRSATNDMVIDNANSILVFKNVDVEGETIKEMRKAGAIIISDNQSARTGGNASVDTVTVQIEFEKMATYIDQVLQNCYDIAGVPLASGQVTSGGDTGQARLLGGGWNNAYIIIHKEIQKLLQFDYEQLKLILMLCKQVPNCPLNELYASQIDINYRVNQNDNLLVKTQSMVNLYQIHCDIEFILKACGLSNDIKTDAQKWKANIEKVQKEQQSQTTTENIVVDENNNNSSQE